MRISNNCFLNHEKALTESTNIYSGTYTFEINRGAIISPKADVTLDINAKIE